MHPKFATLWFFVIVLGFIAAPIAMGDDESSSSKADKEDKKKDEEKKEKPYPDFKKVTKGMESIDGMLTFYRYPRGDSSRDQEKLLCRVPKKLLGKDLLLATSISHGGYFTGWMWDDHLIRFEVSGKKLLLVTPDTRYLHKEGKPITDVVKRTYNRTWLKAIDIKTMKGRDPVIDMSFLKSNLAGIDFHGSIDSDLSTWTKLKVFPDNVLIGVDLASSSRGRGRTVGVTYAFRRLPKKGEYKARKADDRIGYFLTARQDWTKPMDERDMFERFINRWHLEKRDPSLELSPPKKPIIFIIEKTVPIRWRRWVRQGIEDWNKAFEKIGFVDAIVVHQQTADNAFKDYDPEDARHNFFRWIVSGSPFAMGPSRVDPRTGQILDADIILDDSMIRAWIEEVNLFAPSTAAKHKGPAFAKWAKERPGCLACRHKAARAGEPQEHDAVLEKLRKHRPHACNFAVGMRHQISVVYKALLSTAVGKKIPERFFGEIIRETVAHEVGHTLGLRHNFKASSWLSLDEIRKRRQEGDQPTTASVMDYNPILFFAGDEIEKVRHFTTPTIGPYDYWAIQYGYAQPGDGKSEKELLASITSRAPEPGLAYATDEDTMWTISPDPHVFRFDMSSDPIAWTKARVALCDQVLENIQQWAARKGESRSHIRRAFEIIAFERARNFDLVGRYIGGQTFVRDHIGDKGNRPAFTVVPAAKQREALELLGKTIFSDDFFQYDPALLNQLAPSRWDHWGSFAPGRLDYPIHEDVATMQWWTLVDITSEPLLQRVYDAELKSTDPDKFTAAELITRTRDIVWRHLGQPLDRPFTDAKPYVNSIGRGLQREYLGLLLDMVAQGPGWGLSPDLYGMLRHALRELSDRIGAVLRAGERLDFASRAHLTECKSRIDRVLAAPFRGR